MINPLYCYSAFKQKSVVTQNTFIHTIQSLSFVDYYGFKVAPVLLETVFNEPILKTVNNAFNIASAAIVKLETNRCYKWHQDSVRGVCINMLLTPNHKSYCLFGNSTESDDQYEFINLEYESNTFYLFNNQAYHTVVNFDTPRYLFTIEFKKDKNELRYEDVLQWKIDNQV